MELLSFGKRFPERFIHSVGLLIRSYAVNSDIYLMDSQRRGFLSTLSHSTLEKCCGECSEAKDHVE
jgi:hypothetical protein